MNNYALNLVIPQGPTGPQGIQGPTGPSFGLSSYGGRNNVTGGTISLAVATQTQVSLPNTMPSQGLSYENNNIIINQGGTYEITYYINLSTAIATTLTLAVRNNGTNIPSTVITRSLSVGNSTIFNGSTLVNLNANSSIDMALSALVAVGITLGSGNCAYLIVKKIS